MVSGTAIALGALAIGGVGYLYWRARQAQGSSLCASVLQPLGRTVGFDIPPSMCSGIDAIAGKVIGPIVEAVADSAKSWQEKDAENRAKNGAVAVPMTQDVLDTVQCKEIVPGIGTALPTTRDAGPMLHGTALRYQNGCEPFAGAPGFGKCAPGTFDMTTKNAACASAKGVPQMGSLLNGHEPQDPATNYAKNIVAGVKVTCPSGQALDPRNVLSTYDTRTGKTTVTPRCAPPGVVLGGAANTPTGADDSGHESTTVTSGMSGYHWVPAVGAVPGHWERDHA